MNRILKILDEMAKRREASTPGPWIYSNHWDHCKAVVEIAGGKRIICDVYEHEDAYSRNFNHHENNASFIAAARTEHEILEKALRIAYGALKHLNESAEQRDGMSLSEAKCRVAVACEEIEALFEEKK